LQLEPIDEGQFENQSNRIHTGFQNQTIKQQVIMKPADQ